MPHRAIGDVKPEEPAVMPSKWPAHIEAILKRRKDQPVRVYMDGIWDLCHFGHYRAMEQAKRSLPNVHLIVGCCNDEITHRLKGQTVLQDKEVSNEKPAGSIGDRVWLLESFAHLFPLLPFFLRCSATKV